MSFFWIMHQSFVTTAPSPWQPTGKGRDYDFSASVSCYKPQPHRGNKLEVKTCSLHCPSQWKISWEMILMSKPLHFPCTVGTIKKLSHTLAQLSPTLHTTVVPRRKVTLSALSALHVNKGVTFHHDITVWGWRWRGAVVTND